RGDRRRRGRARRCRRVAVGGAGEGGGPEDDDRETRHVHPENTCAKTSSPSFWCPSVPKCSPSLNGARNRSQRTVVSPQDISEYASTAASMAPAFRCARIHAFSSSVVASRDALKYRLNPP